MANKMSEIPPQQPIEPEGVSGTETPPEQEPTLTYEQALSGAKILYEAGVENPISGEHEDPRIQAAWDDIQKWERQRGLHMRGVGTPEKARDIVLAATIWLSAGYRDARILEDALDRLTDELKDARREGNKEVIGILSRAQRDVRRRMSADNPKHNTPERMAEQLFRDKIEEARREVLDEKPWGAIGVLHGMLTDPRLEEVMTEARRQQIVAQREDIRNHADEIKEGKWTFKIAVLD